MRAALAVPLALLFITGAALPLTDWLPSRPPVTDDERTELRNFILALGPITRHDEVVALLLPDDFRDSDTIQYRVRYLLPDRHFILLPEGASAIACWRTTPPPTPRRRIAVQGGLLLR